MKCKYTFAIVSLPLKIYLENLSLCFAIQTIGRKKEKDATRNPGWVLIKRDSIRRFREISVRSPVHKLSETESLLHFPDKPTTLRATRDRVK